MSIFRRLLCHLGIHRYEVAPLDPLHTRNGRLPPLRYACRRCGQYLTRN